MTPPTFHGQSGEWDWTIEPLDGVTVYSCRFQGKCKDLDESQKEALREHTLAHLPEEQVDARSHLDTLCWPLDFQSGNAGRHL